MMDHPPVKEQVIEEQERHGVTPREESRPMKRPIAADYFNQKEEPVTTDSDEPSTKKQRLASTKISEPVNIDHIRSSNTDVYISA